MSLDESKSEKSKTSSIPMIFSWIGVFFFGWLVWVNFMPISQSGSVHFLKVLSCLISIFIFTFFLGNGLLSTGVDKVFAFRITFLISILLPVFGAIYSVAIYQNSNVNTVELFLVVVGVSFLGVLTGLILVVAVKWKLMENHAPPAEIQQTVTDYHAPIQERLVGTTFGKRFFDVCVSIVGLIIAAPLMLIIVLLIMLEDPGPIFYIKNSVGKGGRNFKLYKFRTLVSGAEEQISIVAGDKTPGVVLKVGYLLRKTALDELPQLFNILCGEMSFVGPRPHRTYLALRYIQEVPSFIERHRVLPGLAGLAQVVGDASTPPYQKIRFDQIYINHISLCFDLKLLFLSFLIAFWYRWQPGWNGKLPRRWLHSN